MRVLVVNTGSSSLKLRLLAGHGGEDWTVEASGDVERWDGDDDGPGVREAIEQVLAGGGAVDAVGHRVVHGGTDLTAPALITETVEERIVALSELAPLHQERAVAGWRAVRRLVTDVPHVACFDTAFHTTLPAAAATYALPAAWRERWGLRRFGFHGLSHAWAVRRAPEIAGGAGHARIVSCHLGAGASLCAARDGRSVDTTMGFTPLEGLVMETRSGSVDPGLVLWLINRGGLSPGEVSDGLEHHGGLAGLTGTSGDLRDVLAARAAGDGAAELAFDVYVHRLRREIAAMTAAIGGLDLLVFTGGAGEHSPDVRAATAAGLGFLGVAVDAERNASTASDGDITAAGAPVRTVVVTSREDLEIASQVHALLHR